MRIKAVEGIKAYHRGADLSGLRLSAYPSIPLYFGLSVRAFVNGFRLSCEHRIAECEVLSGYRHLQNFLNLKISERSIKSRKFFYSSSITISLFYYESKFSGISLFERKVIIFKICCIFVFIIYAIIFFKFQVSHNISK